MIVYTFTDAEGAIHPVSYGQDFATLEQRIDTEEESAFNLGAAIGSYVPCEISHRLSEVELYDDVLLARWKITRTVVADPTPPEPEVIRPELPKSTVTARLREIDKFTAVWTLLQGNPDMFDKWYTPDWKNVYCDDPGLLVALPAAGLTPEEVALVTAPL